MRARLQSLAGAVFVACMATSLACVAASVQVLAWQEGPLAYRLSLLAWDAWGLGMAAGAAWLVLSWRRG